jgi:hypothetical protein
VKLHLLSISCSHGKDFLLEYAVSERHYWGWRLVRGLFKHPAMSGATELGELNIMNMSNIYLAVLLAGLAGGVGAQTSPPSTTGNAAQGGQGASGMGPGGQGGEHRHRPPPPEAIAACQGKASGTACSFVGPRGHNRAGACFAPPQAGGEKHPLACRPAHAGGSGGQGGPAQGGQGHPQQTR